jgi:hypothetical protein
MARFVPEIRSFIDRENVLAKIRKEYVKADPDFKATKARLWKRLAPLAKRADELEQAGHRVDCSQQHSREAQWLLNHTADWARAATVIKALRESLKCKDQPPLKQDAGGSWGGCSTEWYRKLEPTVGALLDLDGRTKRRLRPLSFMVRLQDPRWMVAYLKSLQISDIRWTKRNNRDELGALQTDLLQFLFKKKISDALRAHPDLKFQITPAMVKAFREYCLDTQDPETGYWGPSYIFDGKPVTVQDLTFTFHMAHFFRDENDRLGIPRMKQVIDTTLAIKNLRYPAGWKPSARRQYSDHNNWDVLVLFRTGWKSIGADRQARIRREIKKMLRWCLTRSVQGDHFRYIDGDPADAFYFGVCFLDGVGLWDADKRFWTMDNIVVPKGTASPHDLCRKLKDGFAKLKASGESANTVNSLLDDAISKTAPQVRKKQG